MNRIRWTLAGLLGFILVIGFEFAALARPNRWMAGASLLLTLIILLFTTLGARFGRKPASAWWAFALFGWAYLILAFGPWGMHDVEVSEFDRVHLDLPTTFALSRLRETLVAERDGASDAPANDQEQQVELWGAQRGSFAQSGHCLGSLIFALIGLALSPLASPRQPAATKNPDPLREDDPAPTAWVSSPTERDTISTASRSEPPINLDINI